MIDVYQTWCGLCHAMTSNFKKYRIELDDELLHFFAVSLWKNAALKALYAASILLQIHNKCTFLSFFTLHTILCKRIYEKTILRKPVYAICKHKGADQPAHPPSLISTFVVGYLDSIMSFNSFYIRNYKPVASFCGFTGRFESYLGSKTLKTGFLVMRLIILYVF